MWIDDNVDVDVDLDFGRDLPLCQARMKDGQQTTTVENTNRI